MDLIQDLSNSGILFQDIDSITNNKNTAAGDGTWC